MIEDGGDGAGGETFETVVDVDVARIILKARS